MARWGRVWRAGGWSVAAVDGREVGPDLLGLGYAEVGVDVHGKVVVATGGRAVAQATVGVTEAGMSPGLLFAVADLDGHAVGGLVQAQGVGGSVGGGGLSETVEGARFAVSLAALAEDGQRLFVVPGS